MSDDKKVAIAGVGDVTLSPVSVRGEGEEMVGGQALARHMDEHAALKDESERHRRGRAKARGVRSDSRLRSMSRAYELHQEGLSVAQIAVRMNAERDAADAAVSRPGRPAVIAVRTVEKWLKAWRDLVADPEPPAD